MLSAFSIPVVLAVPVLGKKSSILVQKPSKERRISTHSKLILKQVEK